MSENLPDIVRPAPSVADMLHAVIERGVTGDNVAALEKIVGLYERMEQKKAEMAFNEAFSRLQSELIPVQAVRVVPTKTGGVKYKYADYKDIMEQVQPLLTKHGFSVRFSSRSDDKRVTMICTLMHAGGHSVSNEFTNRIGEGPIGSTQTQADGAAGTSAQRNALCDALNIVTRYGDDVRNEGGLITPEQAEELARRVAETNSNKAMFLKLAGSTDFASIKSGKYEVLDEMLTTKERRKA